jgi:acetylornithine/N-succinyldiaminopimelate aminotransferase
MKQSFHGRTMMALTATGQTKYQKGFNPLIPGFSYAELNNFEDLKSKITENTCGIIIEPIQGEGGIIPAKKEFLQKVRALCNEKDIVLVFDEVQCGMGRTGKLFAYELTDVKPDVVSLAKGLGGGFPIGAMMAVQKFADALVPGNHASTFGGNHLACTAAFTVAKRLIKGGLLENVEKMGIILTEKLTELKNKYEFIVDVRGYGFMQGIELNFGDKKETVKDVVLKCMDEGLLLVGAGANTIRFVPPLILNENQINEGIKILDSVLSKI